MNTKPQPPATDKQKWTVKQSDSGVWSVFEGEQLIGDALDRFNAESIAHCHLSALAAHDAEVRKPLVDALKDAKRRLQRYGESTFAIDAALAEVTADAKTDRASDEIVRQG